MLAFKSLCTAPILNRGYLCHVTMHGSYRAAVKAGYII